MAAAVVAAVDTETVAVVAAAAASLHSFDYKSYVNNRHSYGTDGLKEAAAVVVVVAAAAGVAVVVVAADDMTVCSHHDDCDVASDDAVNACFASYADDSDIDVVVVDGIAAVVESLSLRIQFRDRCT